MKTSTSCKKGRSVTLLIAAILSTAYFIYTFVYFVSINDAPETTTDQVAGVIATALVLPHLICVFFAIIFNWLACATKTVGFALTAGVLYLVGCVFMIIYTPFIIVQAILSFIGYSKLKKLKAESKAT